MSIEKITAAITSEAAAESEEILMAAKMESKGILEEAMAVIQEKTKQELEVAEDEKKKIISRRKSVADIDSKKKVLAKKQEMINQCFDQAIENILNLPEAEYVDFLVALSKDMDIAEADLIFNEKDKNGVGPKVAKALGNGFKVSDEIRNIRGGYIIQKGQVFIDNSVEAVVLEKKKELTAQVAAILFPPEQ